MHALTITVYFYFADMLKSYMQLEIKVFPMSLKLLSSHDTGGACYAACFHQDGKLLIGCHNGICVFSDDYDEADHLLKSANVASIASLGDRNSYAFVSHKRNRREVGKTLSADFRDWEEIFNFDCKNNYAAHITASAKFAVACADKGLVAYDLETKAKVLKPLGFQPAVVRFDSKENLLLTSSHTLYKYSMDKHGELTPIWTCEDIAYPGGIAFTRYGDIVVQSLENREIFVISPQGLFYFFYFENLHYITCFQG